MHPKEAINNPASLDNIFVEMHKAYQAQKVPMNDEQMRGSINIMVAEYEHIEEMHNSLGAGAWQFKEFFQRCDAMPIKYDKRLQLWLAVMYYEYGIGAMLLVGYYVQWVAHRGLKLSYALKGEEIPDDRDIDLDFVCVHVFPFGVFTEQTLREFWGKQKVRAQPDNLIDHPGAMLSFMPVKKVGA